MKTVTKTKSTSQKPIEVEQAFLLGQAIALGMAGHVSLDQMIFDMAQALGSDEVIYLRHSLGDAPIRAVAIHGTSEDEMANHIPPATALLPLRAGHVQSFGPRGKRRAMIVLGRTARVLDVMVLSHDCAPILSATADLLTRSWTQRSPGLIRAALDDASTDTAHTPILSPANPFSLTRKEVQVCHFLTEGLKPRDLTERMDCSMPTVRTHLRNIYAKTGLDGMVGVVHQLHKERRAGTERAS